jgi:hypothetical protein
MRRTDSETAALASGLKIVLDPVMNFADRCVLREQKAIALADFGDVTNQHQTAIDNRFPVDVSNKWHTPTEKRDVGALLEFFDHWLHAFERLAGRAIVEPKFGKPHTDRVRMNPDAMER